MRSSVRASRVNVINLNKSYVLNGALIKKIAFEILAFIKKSGSADLDIIFLDDAAIRALNKRYKKRDAPTDVLSFRLDDPGLGTEKFLGEIFISIDKARRNAKLYHAGFGDELVRYVIHGILHLFGYDDLTKKGRSRMSKKEDRVLGHLWERETLSKVLMPR